MKRLLIEIFYALCRQFIIRRAGTGAIYLTFDDGPHPENTVKILRTLARYNAKATFFMIGEQMESEPEIVESVIREGHTLGYHSWCHKSLKKQTIRELSQDFEKARNLSARFNYSIRLYRPPFGDLTIGSFLWLVVHGWKIVMWSRDCRDSFDTIEQVKANIAADRIEEGEIILLHDDYVHAENLIESALESYQARNLVCKCL